MMEVGVVGQEGIEMQRNCSEIEWTSGVCGDVVHAFQTVMDIGFFLTTDEIMKNS